MKVQRVKVLEADDSFGMLPPARAIEITTDRGRAVTPDRCATSYEFAKKAEVPTSVGIGNRVSVYCKHLTGRDVGALLASNGAFGAQLRAMENVDRITGYSVLHVPVFRLAKTASVGKAPMEILRGDNLDKFLRILIILQEEAGHDMISVPHLDMPLGDLKKTLRGAHEAITKIGKQAVFSLDMRYGRFPELLDYVADDLQAGVLNLHYAERRDVPRHYEHLGGFAGREIAFLMTGVDREDADRGGLSTMHYMPFLGCDLLAVRPPRPAGRALRGASRMRSLRVMNRDELTIVPIMGKKVPIRSILDQLDSPRSDDLSACLRNVGKAEKDEEKYRSVSALTRLQELLASTDEFSALAEHIRKRSAKEYVRGKKGLERRLEGV